MTFRHFIRQAKDELLRRGEAVTVDMVIDHALTYEGAQEALDLESGTKARAWARREASSMLKELDEPNDDPETAQLFNDAAYRPPRCISFRDEAGEVRRKAIEFATYPECVGYSRMLDENITAAQRTRREWLQWFRAHEEGIAHAGTVGDALRREHRKAA